MLTQDYAYYLFRILMAGLPSLPGILMVLFLLGAFISLAVFKPSRPKLRAYAFWLSLLASALLAVFILYTASFEFEEQSDTLSETGLPDLASSCGTGWTNWTKAGYGMGNPCPKGCYRGLTLRKQLKMSGFPPWPQYRRELQCWTNEE